MDIALAAIVIIVPMAIIAIGALVVLRIVANVAKGADRIVAELKDVAARSDDRDGPWSGSH